MLNVEVQAENYYELDHIILNAGYVKVAVLGGDHVYAKLTAPLSFPSRIASWSAWHQISFTFASLLTSEH